MKNLLVAFLLMISSAAFSQTDSTLIKFSNASDEDLQEIIELLDIQYIKFICEDTLMRGKKFFLSVSEYHEGIIIKKDTLNANCKEEIISIQMGDKVANMLVNNCDKIIFGQQFKSYKVKLAGAFKDSCLKMKITNPGIINNVSLNGDSNYILKAVNACKNTDELIIPVHIETPVLTYAPPVKAISGGYSSYCIQGEEDVENWYATFKMHHYYVISLRID